VAMRVGGGGGSTSTRREMAAGADGDISTAVAAGIIVVAGEARLARAVTWPKGGKMFSARALLAPLQSCIVTRG
jgi:hypothetical protein